MRTVLAYIDQKTVDYEQLALFEFMRDSTLSVRDRLAFVPCLAINARGKFEKGKLHVAQIDASRTGRPERSA